MTKTLYSTSISAAKGLMKRASSVLFVYILGRSQFVIAMSRMRRRNFQFTGDPDRRGLISSNEPTDLTTMYWADLVMGRVDQTPTQSADVCKQ